MLLFILISAFLILSNSTPPQLVAISAFIQSVFVSVAAIATAYVAWKGLNKWQDETTFKAEFELAKEVVECTYKVRNATEHLKYPQFPIWSVEYSKVCLDRDVKSTLDLLEHYDSLLVQVEALLDEKTFLFATNVKNKALIIASCFEGMHETALNMLDFKKSLKDTPDDDNFDSYTYEVERGKERLDEYKIPLKILHQSEVEHLGKECKLNSDNLHLNLVGLIENLTANMQQYLRR